MRLEQFARWTMEEPTMKPKQFLLRLALTLTLCIPTLMMGATIPTARLATQPKITVTGSSAATRTAPVTSTIDPARRFAWAIAKQEGFFLRGTIPARNHNPGDLKSVRGYRFPGQVGIDRHNHVIFRNDNAGWAALENQVRKMCTSQGKYSAAMTIQQVARLYARNWKRWSTNVSAYMKCPSTVTLAELFNIPPSLPAYVDLRVIDEILPQAPVLPTMDSDKDALELWEMYQVDSMDIRRMQLIA